MKMIYFTINRHILINCKYKKQLNLKLLSNNVALCFGNEALLTRNALYECRHLFSSSEKIPIVFYL